jgi:abhydrolase domain-containing protein 17
VFWEIGSFMQSIWVFFQYLFYTILAFWVGLAFVGYFLSEGMIFFPPYPPTYTKLPHQVMLKTPSGLTIAAVYRHHPKARYTVLLSHGNAADLGTFYAFIQTVYEHGYSVMAYDYPGYGQSSGRASERGTYEAAEQAYAYLTKTQSIDPKSIIAFGHSLGAALAIHLASEHPLGGLIVESPFVTAFRVRTYWPLLPFDRYDNLSKLKTIRCPLLLIHGTADAVVPIWHGKMLYQAFTGQKQALWLDGLGHNNVHADAAVAFWSTWQAWVAGLLKKP